MLALKMVKKQYRKCRGTDIKDCWRQARSDIIPKKP